MDLDIWREGVNEAIININELLKNGYLFIIFFS